MDPPVSNQEMMAGQQQHRSITTHFKVLCVEARNETSHSHSLIKIVLGDKFLFLMSLQRGKDLVFPFSTASKTVAYGTQ